MLKIKAVPKTNNPDWGFYGTIKTVTDAGDAAAQKVWDAMVKKIKNLYPSYTDAEIVKFLDNRVGRHLADDIGVNKGKRDINTILKVIKNLNRAEMDKWYRYYYQLG